MLVLYLLAIEFMPVLDGHMQAALSDSRPRPILHLLYSLNITVKDLVFT
jgi:hypothetical protein